MFERVLNMPMETIYEKSSPEFFLKKSFMTPFYGWGSNAGVPQGSILGPTLPLLHMILSVTLLSMLMILLSTLKCDQASDLSQRL